MRCTNQKYLLPIPVERASLILVLAEVLLSWLKIMKPEKTLKHHHEISLYM